jgi:hypothetical protein
MDAFVVAQDILTATGPVTVPVPGVITGADTIPGLRIVRTEEATALFAEPASKPIAFTFVVLMIWKGAEYSLVKVVPTTGVLPVVV